jgi:hypothetical protein
LSNHPWIAGVLCVFELSKTTWTAAGGNVVVDQIQEPAELDRPVLRPGLGHDVPGRQVQRGEQVRDAVTLVISRWSRSG